MFLVGCNKPEARSVEYFAAHEDEAKAILADCTADKIRGEECDNARQGAATASASRAMKFN